MAYLLALVSLTLLPACANDGGWVRIRPQEADWIEKGQTTREQITERFGEPELTATRKDDPATGEYVEYPMLSTPEVYTGRGFSSPFEPRPRGSLPQVYRPPTESLESTEKVRREAPRLWIEYDARGVVRDFGIVPSARDTPGP